MKTSKIAAIIIWSLVAILLTVFLVAAINYGNFGFIGWSGIAMYDSPEDYTVGGFEIADTEALRDIEINWISGSVKVVAYDGDVITCTESETKREEDRLRWKYEDGNLTIQYCKPRKFIFSFGHTIKDKDLVLYIPKSITEIGKLRIDSVSADIDANGIICKELGIESVSGRSECAGMSSDIINIDVVSGNVSIEGSSATVHCDTVSGNIRLTDSVMPSEVDIESVSGDIILNIADGDGFTANFDSVSGEFSCDFSTVKNGKKYVSGDGSGVYSFETVSGDVTINKIN